MAIGAAQRRALTSSTIPMLAAPKLRAAAVAWQAKRALAQQQQLWLLTIRAVDLITIRRSPSPERRALPGKGDQGFIKGGGKGGTGKGGTGKGNKG